jgi:hypothetical protein
VVVSVVSVVAVGDKASDVVVIVVVVMERGDGRIEVKGSAIDTCVVRRQCRLGSSASNASADLL